MRDMSRVVRFGDMRAGLRGTGIGRGRWRVLEIEIGGEIVERVIVGVGVEVTVAEAEVFRDG